MPSLGALRPALASLNQVFGRLDSVLQGERRFTASAVHELGTPLAAISSKIQLVGRLHGSKSAPLNTDLEELGAEVKRASHLVDNLLLLARLDPADGYALQSAEIDFEALVRASIADVVDVAKRKRLRINTEISATTIQGQADLVGIALRNMLDNAVRYADDGGIVKVIVGKDRNAATIEVRDNGPGVSEANLSRIAEQIATLHQGTMSLRHNPET